MSRCGNKAHIECEVSSEVVGQPGCVQVQRKGREDLTASETFQIAQTKMTLKWPDLPDGKGSHIGGRQVDWKGLNKLKYKTKFENQDFELSFNVPGCKGKKSSRRIKIEAFPNAGPEKRRIGFAMDIEHGKHKKPFPASVQQAAKWVKKNAGNFRIEFRDGEIIVTVLVHLVVAGTQTPVEDKVFNHFKRLAESFWNSPAEGYRQWVFHREGCLRKDDCNCRVVYARESRSDEKLLQGGCCKFPIKVRIEKGPDNVVGVEFLSQSDILQTWIANPGLISGGGHPVYGPFTVHTQLVCYPEDVPKTYAHEVGHMMGLPDEYPNGAVAKDQSLFPLTDDSVMGTNWKGKAYQRHLDYPPMFLDWVNQHVTSVKVIKRS